MKHLEMYPTGTWGFGIEGKSKVDVREPEDRPSARVGHGGGVLEGQRDAGVTGLGWARTKGMARTGSKWRVFCRGHPLTEFQGIGVRVDRHTED